MSRIAVRDVTEDTFEQDVIERSRDVPVVVDLWAEWCGPCRALGPLLERLAAEADGSWELAKVDVDSNQALAARMGVQGIPAVRAFKDGRQVAEFVGALPEPQVRSWLAQLGPTPAERALEEGADAQRRGDLGAAVEAYRRALNLDPSHSGARAALEHAELAERVLELDEDALRLRLEREPDDVDAAMGVADLRAARDDLEGAFGLLVELVGRTNGPDREAARAHLLRLLDAAPASDPRVAAGRKSLSRVLF